MKIVVLLFSFLFLAGCSKVAFKPIEKQSVLQNSPVLGDGGNGGAGGGRTETGGTGSGGILPGGIVPGGTGLPNGQIKFEGGEQAQQTGTVNSGNLQITVGRLCSDGLTFGLGVNAQSATSLTLQILNASDSVICSRSDTAQIKTDLNAGLLKISGCNLANGSYTVSLTANGTVNLVQWSVGAFTVASGVVTSGPISILLDSNPDQAEFDQGSNSTSLAFHNSTCDVKASPLYVDFRKDTSQTDVLTSPEDGVMFDILGANGTPAYTKSRISWFNSAKFALLTLPNSRGQVNGIDELFGNNTLGRDGKFADNGFLALAKYDDNDDQVIDSKDKVFSSLRLWFDYNLDGIASSRELVSLTEKRLVAIDLEYDANYYERDQYGNEIKFKSVVRFASGALRSIFDVWFKL